MNNNKNIKLIRFEITASIILLSLVEIALYQYAAFQISKDLLQSIIFAISVILVLWIAKRYINRIEIPVLIFMFLFNVMANLQKLGLEVKDKTLEEVQAEFCKTHAWQKCQVQTTPSIGKEKNYPREVSWEEAKSYKWNWTMFKEYNKDVPRLQKEFNKDKADFEKRKSEIDNWNKEFLALTPSKFSHLEKMSKSFNSLSIQETMWLILRLVFGLFISIMLVELFDRFSQVWKPLEVETRKVDSVEVEAIQKMALLKTDSHWRFRDPKNILKNFPLFPIEDGLRIIYEVRNASLPQKPLNSLKQDVKGIQGRSKGETPLASSNVVFFPKKLA